MQEIKKIQKWVIFSGIICVQNGDNPLVGWEVYCMGTRHRDMTSWYSLCVHNSKSKVKGLRNISSCNKYSASVSRTLKQYNNTLKNFYMQYVVLCSIYPAPISSTKFLLFTCIQHLLNYLTIWFLHGFIPDLLHSIWRTTND